MAATRPRCPGAYCGSPPPQRWTCTATGAAVVPVSVARSARTRATSSASSTCRVAASPKRPSEARSRTSPSGERWAHLVVECVAALIANGSSAATSTPEVAGRVTSSGR
jgi:hypothetical protein